MFTSALFDENAIVIFSMTCGTECPRVPLSLIGLKKSFKKLHECYSNNAVVTPTDKDKQRSEKYCTRKACKRVERL